jgi:hypothetical protein
MIETSFLSMLSAVAHTATPPADAGCLSLTEIKDLVIALAAAVGAGVGVLGLKAWRRQLKGNTEYELARRLLRAVYRVRNALQNVRNPFISSGEIVQALKDAGKAPEEIKRDLAKAEVDGAVYAARWKPVADAISELQVEALEAEVIWDATVSDTLKPLYKCVSELNVSLWQFLRDTQGGYRRGLPPEQIEKIEKVVYFESSDPEKDNFTRGLQAAVGLVEKLAKPKLKI